ncbi:MAG: hypothetical protein ACK5NY_09170 [Burkholderiaceae bacterium]|jgi:hypothetical protein
MSKHQPLLDARKELLLLKVKMQRMELRHACDEVREAFSWRHWLGSPLRTLSSPGGLLMAVRLGRRALRFYPLVLSIVSLFGFSKRNKTPRNTRGASPVSFFGRLLRAVSLGGLLGALSRWYHRSR